jgi:hypothetical protein
MIGMIPKTGREVKLREAPVDEAVVAWRVQTKSNGPNRAANGIFPLGFAPVNHAGIQLSKRTAQRLKSCRPDTTGFTLSFTTSDIIL